jgi:hypothetical protein
MFGQEVVLGAGLHARFSFFDYIIVLCMQFSFSFGFRRVVRFIHNIMFW